MADAFAAPFVAATITSESQIIKHQICNLQFTVQYSKPSSFANFLSANLLIHIFKLIQKDIFDVKKWTILYLQIQDSRSKMEERIYSEKRLKHECRRELQKSGISGNP